MFTTVISLVELHSLVVFYLTVFVGNRRDKQGQTCHCTWRWWSHHRPSVPRRTGIEKECVCAGRKACEAEGMKQLLVFALHSKSKL